MRHTEIKINCSSKRIIRVALLTFNSTGLGVTYFDSINNFFWHIGKAQGPLTQHDSDWSTWDPYVLALGSTLCVLVFANNQNAMPNHIAKFANYIYKSEIWRVEEEKQLSKLSQFIEISGSASKAIISSSSLLAAVQDWTGSWPLSFSASGLALAGNFGATFIVTKQHTAWRPRYSAKVANSIALFIGITYGASQGMLYMNTLFNPLLLTGVLTQRPGLINTDTTGLWIFMANLYPWTEFVISSGASMYKRTLQVLGPEQKAEESKITQYDQWRGSVAAFYRSMALLAAVFCFLYSWNDNPAVAGSISLLFLFAVPGVFALLYPYPNTKPVVQTQALVTVSANSCSFSFDSNIQSPDLQQPLLLPENGCS